MSEFNDHPPRGAATTTPGVRPRGSTAVLDRVEPDEEQSLRRAPEIRRPGAIGSVTVRAPLLDPTRSAPGRSKADPDPTQGTDIPRARASRRTSRTPTAHPRFTDRQRAIRRSVRASRVRPFILPIVFGLAAIVGLAIVFLSPVLSVRTVVLRFDGPASQQSEIAATITPMKGQNIFRVDPASREATLRSLPWVSEVSVRRSFPRTVEVRVTAHDVAGAVRLPGRLVAMAATDGSVLSVVADADRSVALLPEFDLGLTAVPEPGDALADPSPSVLAGAAAIERLLPGRLEIVELRSGSVEWLLRPVGGNPPVRVLVGRPRDSDVPAAALVSVLGRIGPLPTIIDLRTPETPVLTFSDARS